MMQLMFKLPPWLLAIFIDQPGLKYLYVMILNEGSFAFCLYRYLSLGNLRDANILMDEVKKQVQSGEIDFPRTELMQLTNYLLQT